MTELTFEAQLLKVSFRFCRLAKEDLSTFVDEGNLIEDLDASVSNPVDHDIIACAERTSYAD